MGLTRRGVEALETISAAFGGPSSKEIPLMSFTRADTGAPLAVFANAASGTGAAPGTQLTNSKALTIRWNNDSAFVGILASFLIPRDADVTETITLKMNVSKTGATLADAAVMVIAAYNQAVGALHDADTDFSGNTGALTGDLTAKTISTLSLATPWATTDLAAYPTSVSLVITPSVLATDDLVLHAVWIEYTRKNPT